MKIEWSDKRCIVCLGWRDTGEAGLQTTKGHVIPKAIGGRLWAPFLCKGCNSKMGTIEEKLLGDVSVIEMARQLLPTLPSKLGLRIHSRAGYFLDHEEHDRLYAKPSRDDGDLELTTTDANTRLDEDVRKEVETKLHAAGVSGDEFEETLAEYDAAIPGNEFEFQPGQKVRKPIDVTGQVFGRTYDEPIVPAVVPFGVAYLFLACCIGNGIYDSAFDPVREVLSQAVGGDEEATKEWPIDWLRSTADAAPLHGLALEESGGEATVRVVIFRWLVWRVHFPMLAPPADVWHYSRNVATGGEETNLNHLCAS